VHGIEYDGYSDYYDVLPAAAAPSQAAESAASDAILLLAAAGLRGTTPSGQMMHTISLREALLWAGGSRGPLEQQQQQQQQVDYYDYDELAGASSSIVVDISYSSSSEGFASVQTELGEFSSAVVLDLQALLWAIKLAACQGTLLAAVLVLYIWSSALLERRLERLEASMADMADLLAASGKGLDTV
jgi:hypothetical protein